MFNINNDFLLYDFEPEKLGFGLRDFYGKILDPVPHRTSGLL